ncbi:MAG: phage holin family protein [Oscillospiraceae bacterium]|nr:phage holin family protein [Oscillospiraceae bacterium]
MTEFEKICFSCITGVVAMITRQYALIFILVCAGIVLDCITGLIKSKVTGTAITSKKGIRGFWKKTGFIFSFAFGIFLDCFIPILLNIIHIDLPFASPFGLIIGVYIILNESISIAENLIKINPESVPKWIVSLLKNTADKIDSEEK